MSRVCYTEGVRDFAEHAGGGAHWLLDILASESAILGLVRSGCMAFATLAVKSGRALLNINDGNDSPPVVSRAIDYTDCPEGDWLIYLSQTEVGGQPGIVMLLPSEY